MAKVIGAAFDGMDRLNGRVEARATDEKLDRLAADSELFEEVAMARRVAELCVAFVMLEGEAPLVLTERSDARENYSRLVEAGAV